MATVILDDQLANELIEDRRTRGADRYDEVWEGTYIMSPIANNEHQSLATSLAALLKLNVAMAKSGSVFCGCNVSDRETDWTQNYRVPDVAFFRKDTKAMDRQSHWFGGPDLAVEIVSDGDRSRDKFDFYASVSTSEILIIDRNPWQLELHRLRHGSHGLVARHRLGDVEPIVSDVVGVAMKLLDNGNSSPAIQITEIATGESWTI